MKNEQLSHLAYQHFLNTPFNDLLDGNDGSVEPNGLESRLSALTEYAKERIPAYAKMYSQFKESLPFLTKENFVNVYDMKSRCKDGLLSGLEMIHSSSGSSNAKGPTYWGRNVQDELSIAVRFEQIFLDSFDAHEKDTLAINAFPMGRWVGGLFTSFCTRYVSQKGYRITQVTPGNNIQEIIKVASDLHGMFDQTIVLGYPPFVKMVIDEQFRKSQDFWKPYNLGFVFAGEVFSEEWRMLLAKRANVSQPERQIVSIYGTADAGVIASESILSAKIRAFLARNPEISKELFGLDRIPSLMQYDPQTRFLEKRPDDQTLAITTVPWKHLSESNEIAASRMCMPLIRYGIGDDGGIMSFQDMIEFVERKGMNLNLNDFNYRTLPFVWVFGRKFWTISLYGANVYVENIMVGLEAPEISEIVTGKFVLALKSDLDDCRLLIRIELCPGVSFKDQENEHRIAVLIRDQIKRLNSEYNHYVPEEKQLPEIIFHQYGNDIYFKQGVKHKYIL